MVSQVVRYAAKIILTNIEAMFPPFSLTTSVTYWTKGELHEFVASEAGARPNFSQLDQRNEGRGRLARTWSLKIA
jgi:hypothetical protein